MYKGIRCMELYQTIGSTHKEVMKRSARMLRSLSDVVWGSTEPGQYMVGDVLGDRRYRATGRNATGH